MSFWEMSIRKNVYSGKCHLGNCLPGSCSSGKRFWGTVCVGKVRWGNVCWGTILEPRLLCNRYRLISFIWNLLRNYAPNCFLLKSIPISLCLNLFFLSELFINALVSIFERIQQQLNIDNYTIDIFVDLIKSIWYSGPWCTD